MIKTGLKNLSYFLLIFYLTGCASYFTPVKTIPARLGDETSMKKELTSLPLPKEKIVAAVYKFRDQTGQYKPSEVGTSWSTAVTQGATSILLRALEESGWFIAIEREGLSNLLNERQIIRSSVANYSGAEGKEEGPLLPPLLYAGVLLEGGIISYDANILTGGAGLKYFGAGASGQYREDKVTIYLRAISTKNGRILKTVYTSKTILSQMIDVGFFRFVKFKRLLEAETGFSYNEPVTMCVTEAIEKAVYSLIIEGILEGYWELNDSTLKNSSFIKEYLKEKEENDNIDYLGRELVDNFKYGIGINGGGLLYSGDYSNSVTKPFGELYLAYSLQPDLYLNLSGSFGQTGVKKYFTADLYSGELSLKYNFFSDVQLNPYILLGAGVSYAYIKDRFGKQMFPDNKLIPFINSALGMEYRFTEKFGLNVSLNNFYMLRDDLDGAERGELNDYSWGGKIGFIFYTNL